MRLHYFTFSLRRLYPTGDLRAINLKCQSKIVEIVLRKGTRKGTRKGKKLIDVKEKKLRSEREKLRSFCV
jgi:hypothetical protein